MLEHSDYPLPPANKQKTKMADELFQPAWVGKGSRRRQIVGAFLGYACIKNMQKCRILILRLMVDGLDESSQESGTLGKASLDKSKQVGQIQN